MIRLAALFLLLAFAGPAVAQQPITVRGRVVAAENGQPLRRALVTALRTQRQSRPTLTDEDGRFELTTADRPAAIEASKAGYAPSKIEITRDAIAPGREIGIRLSRGAAVSGRVLRSTGAPVTGAGVQARRIGAADAKQKEEDVTVEAVTDDLGEYRISGLSAGRYDVSPQRPLRPAELRMLFVPQSGGSPREVLPALSASTNSGRTIELRPSDDASPMDFQVESSEVPDVLHLTPLPIDVVDPVTRGGRTDLEAVLRSREIAAERERERTSGAVTGTLVDQAGEPIQRIHVRVLQVRQEEARMVARDIGPDRLTDDRGRYRLSGLPSGRYFVVAYIDATASGLDRAAGNGFTRVYYPGTANVEGAQAIEVTASGDLTGVDFTFAPSRAARVTGIALDRSGEPLVGQVRLFVSHRSGSVAAEPLIERVDWDGTFTIRDVPRGDFVLQAVGTNPGHRDEFGVEYVTVDDRDPPPLTITTSVGATLEGQFTVEGIREPPLRALSIHAASSDFDRAPAEGRGPDGLAVHDDGRFSLNGLRGSMRLVAADAMPRWYLKSLTIGGVDATDAPFDFGVAERTYTDAEIVFSPAGATIGGTVTDGPGTRATSFVALAFSTDRQLWFSGSRHLKKRPGGANGSFDVDGLPPGEYWVAAVDRLDAGDWQTPDVLESLVRQARRVTVTEGQIQSTELRLIRRAVTSPR